ncbi:MAG: helix-turn-helix transcriptional regulator [Legionellales bacterium]|nr:helix-turn-helix transcriptional regulator [Legionellales bacterium]
MKNSLQIANRLKFSRVKAGFKSAKAFAVTHNIPYITYSQHEAGKRKLSPEIILKYSQYMKVSPGWLLTGQGSEEEIQQDSEEYEPTSPSQVDLACQSSDSVEYKILSYAGITSFRINADLFADIYIEVNNLLGNLNSNISDRDKIKLCIDLYQTLSSVDKDTQSKFDILKALVNAIKTIKYRNVA